MLNNYDDIIHLPHPTSAKHPRMTMLARAAQFAPFAALTGHGAALQETARLTDQQQELGEYDNEVLNRKLMLLLSHLEEHPKVRITHFLPDQHKEGGSYVTVEGMVKRLDEYEQVLYMEDGRQIPLTSISDIQEI